MYRVSSVIVLAWLTLSLGRALAASTTAPSSTASSSNQDSTPSINETMTTKEGNTSSLSGKDDMMTSEEMDDNDMVNVLAIMTECNDSFRIEMAYMQSLNESGSFPDETDRTPKCYVRCVLEKTGVVSLDGVFDPTRAAVILSGKRNGKSMDNIQEMATRCAADRNEKCKCERSYRFIKCLMESEIKEYESI